MNYQVDTSPYLREGLINNELWATYYPATCIDIIARGLVFAGNYETERNFFFLLKYSCVIHCSKCFTDNNIFNRWVWDTEIGSTGSMS